MPFRKAGRIRGDSDGFHLEEGVFEGRNAPEAMVHSVMNFRRQMWGGSADVGATLSGRRRVVKPLGGHGQ